MSNKTLERGRENFACLPWNIVTAVINYIRYILHKYFYRLKLFYIMQIPQVKIRPGILFERFWVGCYLSKFCSSNSRKRLTGRATNNYINCAFLLRKPKLNH